ncbi:MAG: site-specific integrase [Oscillospiraceae bacterium]|nr:site-specific integrase [Oscillospiraceae bacterium]
MAEQWLASKKLKIKESTFACYATMIKKHILPELGKVPVNTVHSALLSEFLEKKKSSGRLCGGALSDKTVADMKSLLMQILRFAKARGALQTLPECPPIGNRQPDISVLTKQEQSQVEKQAMEEDTPFSLGVLLALYSGIRIGEVCALQWRDFDWKNGTVAIGKTISRMADMDEHTDFKTKVVINTPKTACSIRTIPLPTSVFLYLMQHRQGDDCYILTGTIRYMEPRVCLDCYKRLLCRAGVANHTFHTLRHTFATRCVENGVDIKSLSEIMGHSNVKITLQRYVHPSMDAKKEQVNKLPYFNAGGQIRGQAYARIV